MINNIKQAIEKTLDNATYEYEVHDDFSVFYITHKEVGKCQVTLTFSDDGLSYIDGEISNYALKRLEAEIDRL